MNKLSSFLVVAAVLFSLLFACSPREIESDFSGSSSIYPMLKPGEKTENMVIATGVDPAYPLSRFCTPKKENDHSIKVDCSELSICANIAIGETFGVLDLIPPSMDREGLDWEMSVNGHPIDLEAFAASNSVYPGLAPRPSPIREVFKVARGWDVVLVNPTPGMHTLQGRVQPRDGTEAYTWTVTFTVASQ